MNSRYDIYNPTDEEKAEDKYNKNIRKRKASILIKSEQEFEEVKNYDTI